MTEKEWDKKLRKKIEISTYTDEIWKYILADRKHQKSETLKRVPSVSEIAYSIFKAIKESVGSDSISKAVHKLVKDKLK